MEQTDDRTEDCCEGHASYPKWELCELSSGEQMLGAEQSQAGLWVTQVWTPVTQWPSRARCADWEQGHNGLSYFWLLCCVFVLITKILHCREFGKHIKAHRKTQKSPLTPSPRSNHRYYHVQRCAATGEAQVSVSEAAWWSQSHLPPDVWAPGTLLTSLSLSFLVQKTGTILTLLPS